MEHKMSSENSGSLKEFCSQCNLEFVDKKTFKQHNIQLHGGKKVIKCHLCCTVFNRQDHLKRHMHSVHLYKKYYHCPVCDENCERYANLLNHINTFHSETSVIFHCRGCEFQCENLANLEEHETTCLLLERHTCPHCKTCFKRRDHMLRHVKSRHTNQSINCPICGQVYRRKDHVTRHIKEKHQWEAVDETFVTDCLSMELSC